MGVGDHIASAVDHEAGAQGTGLELAPGGRLAAEEPPEELLQRSTPEALGQARDPVAVGYMAGGGDVYHRRTVIRSDAGDVAGGPVRGRRRPGGRGYPGGLGPGRRLRAADDRQGQQEASEDSQGGGHGGLRGENGWFARSFDPIIPVLAPEPRPPPGPAQRPGPGPAPSGAATRSRGEPRPP